MKTKDEPKKLGFVYLISAEGTSFYKVGVTRTRRPERRLEDLQGANPSRLILLDCVEVENPYAYEESLHKTLTISRARGGGEWFDLSDVQVTAIRADFATMRAVADGAITDLAAAIEFKKSTFRMWRTRAEVKRRRGMQLLITVIAAKWLGMAGWWIYHLAA